MATSEGTLHIDSARPRVIQLGGRPRYPDAPRRRVVEMPWLVRKPGVTPRLGALLPDVYPALHDGFRALVTELWGGLLERCASPMIVGETVTQHSVTVLGFVRYVLHHRDGQLTLEQLSRTPAGTRRWRRVHFCFAADLPFRPSPALFSDLLQESASRLATFARNADSVSRLVDGVARSFRRAALQAVNWHRLRQAVRETLDLDPEVLDLARRSRGNAHVREVTDRHFNHVGDHIEAYREIEADAPNLLWLYALARGEQVALPTRGGVVAGLRQTILMDFDLPPLAWRYLANGRRRDFSIVLDWLGPHASPKGRWRELREYLRLLVALRRQEPIPLPVQRLFLHDAYRVSPDLEFVFFRGVMLPIHTMRCLIKEAETQLAKGTLRVFTENDLPDVLTWLGKTEAELDERQQKAGWAYLLRQARQWKYEESACLERQAQGWTSLLAVQQVGRFTIDPISNAWQLHREALGMRNCANGYLAACLDDTIRLFAVRNVGGKQIGTVGLTRAEREWRVLDVRGVANAAPDTALRDLAYSLAERYTTSWQTLHPLVTSVPVAR